MRSGSACPFAGQRVAPSADPLDADCRAHDHQATSAASKDCLRSYLAASDCASVLPYILLEGADLKAAHHLTWWVGGAESDATNRAIAQRTCAVSVLAAGPRVSVAGPGRRTAGRGLA